MGANHTTSLSAPQGSGGRVNGKWSLFFYVTLAAISTLGMLLNPSIVFCGGMEDKLAERIRAYWNAKSNNDFRSAYEMESPRFRKELAFEKYEELNRNATLRISAVEIRNVVAEGDNGRADVIFHVDISQGPIPFSIVTPPRTDQWERIDGVWYKKYFPPELLFSINQMTVPAGPR
jgi:hypothetical protein